MSAPQQSGWPLAGLSLGIWAGRHNRHVFIGLTRRQRCLYLQVAWGPSLLYGWRCAVRLALLGQRAGG